MNLLTSPASNSKAGIVQLKRERFKTSAGLPVLVAVDVPVVPAEELGLPND